MKEPTRLTEIIIKTWPNGQTSLALAALRFCLGDDPALRLSHPSPATPSPAGGPDLGLAPGQVPGQRYLVEYAPFAQTAVARFEQALAQGTVTDDAAGFARFASEDFTPYTAFLNHWVRSDLVRDQIVLNLADLYDNPVAWLHWVLGMLTPDQPPRPDQLDRITRAAPGWVAAHPPPDLTTFRHYDATLFDQLGRFTLRRDVVQRVFQEVMGRNLEEKGFLDFQCQPNIEKLSIRLMDSAEYQMRQTGAVNRARHKGVPLTADQITLAYQVLFGRAASPIEMARNSADKENALSLRELLLSSSEFAAQFNERVQREKAIHPPALVHLHIPKSAGTSLTRILANNFKPGTKYALDLRDIETFRALSDQQRRRFRLVFGHLDHGIGKMMPQGCIYVCALRKPGARLLSYYRYMKRRTDHPNHTVFMGDNMSFGKFLEYYSNRPAVERAEVDNGQVRRIAGPMDGQIKDDGEAMFRTAVANIFSPDMIFGLTEHFDLLLAELKNRQLIETYEPVFENADPEKINFAVAVAELTPGQRALLDQFTRWDNKLYAICESYIQSLTPFGAITDRKP